MAIETKHANIRRNSDNVLLYGVTAEVNTATYPLTTTGKNAFKNAVKGGTYAGPLTVDNGAIIPANTVPPLVKPAAPGGGSSIPALNLHLEAENATGSIPLDGTQRGPIGQGGSLTALAYTATNPNGVTISGVSLKHKYQTNTAQTGTGQYRVNSGGWVDFNLEGADGGVRTTTLSTTIQLVAGANTIEFRWKDGTVYMHDWIELTRPAS
ncbi:hypothetical protein [Spirosoma areae]